MKKIKAILKNQYELIIQEKANKGDIIDLNNISIDLKEIIDNNIINEKEKYIQHLQNEHEKEINNKNIEINQLKLQRFSSNTKLIGENLEKWCDNEVQNQLLILSDAVWFKDNEIINNSKGDFIYKVYASENKNEEIILTSALIEIKSEMKTDYIGKKQKNEIHFKKLNNDRQNKNLEFAILVSELEYEQINDLPIKKVLEYDKMYIVRPPYLVTFLNIITSLARKNKELILKLNNDKVEFEETQKIIDNFLEMKNQIIDNSLRKIQNNLEIVAKENEIIQEAGEKILKSNQKINEKIKTINQKHFKTVINKINNFKIQKIIKKIKKINNTE